VKEVQKTTTQSALGGRKKAANDSSERKGTPGRRYIFQDQGKGMRPLSRGKRRRKTQDSDKGKIRVRSVIWIGPFLISVTEEGEYR